MSIPRSRRASVADAAPNADTTTPTVLVASADLTLRASISAALTSDGHDIADALDGPAAVEHVRRSEPDVIVLDSRLADEDVLTLCGQLRTLTDACILVLADWTTE